ncbi:hypothetical protein [Natronobacterium texcoconense]|nr:hypothetical protein [Natronobacterium texcoconense]
MTLESIGVTTTKAPFSPTQGGMTGQPTEVGLKGVAGIREDGRR